jgi:hypothetical protein
MRLREPVLKLIALAISGSASCGLFLENKGEHQMGVTAERDEVLPNQRD